MTPKNQADLDRYYNAIRLLTASGFDVPEELYRAVDLKLHTSKQQELKDWLNSCPTFIASDMTLLVKQNFPEYYI